MSIPATPPIVSQAVPPQRLRVAVLPLTGADASDESRWLGALFASLLAEHLAVSPVQVIPYNESAAALIDGAFSLPLSPEQAEALMATLKAGALIEGRYVLDMAGNMLGFRLNVSGEVPVAPRLEAAAPLPTFARFVERISLALLERLDQPVTDNIRVAVNQVARPASFEAFRQLARARAAWARGENELALTAVQSALSLDPDLEAAMRIEVAISRDANDSLTVREAFRRWAGHASRQNQHGLAAERMLMLGHWFGARGDWAEARRSYDEAGKHYQRANDEIGAARVLNNIANLEMQMGHISEGIRSYRRTLRSYETQPAAALDMAITLLNVGLAHKSQGQREEALAAMEDALKRARDLRDRRLEAYCLAQRGALHDDMGMWSQAEQDYLAAGAIFEKLGDAWGLALLRSYQALLLKQQGAYDRAESMLLDALGRFERMHNSHEVAIVCFNLGDLYLALGAFEQALSYADRAYKGFNGLRSGWTQNARDLRDEVQTLLEAQARERADAEARRQAEEAARRRAEEEARRRAEADAEARRIAEAEAEARRLAELAAQNPPPPPIDLDQPST